LLIRANEDKKSKNTQNDRIDDKTKQANQEFRSPRDVVLNTVTVFNHVCSKRVKDLYKVINDSSLKVGELLDSKSHCKLIEIAHALLKLWDENNVLNGVGLQKLLTIFR
jgi:hypothetical protein